ncbi:MULTISPECIES: hypothetical protein [Burkholderia cepacia complex]|uniref:hypothetical protein n=1 Tax=Burkholderia cepacia complex TaxID=87882 RepID=UPI001F0CDCA2|nr:MULTISPECIES: hypothetical protein [Burkholderia cepacia complex]
MNDNYTRCGTPLVYKGVLRLHTDSLTDEQLSNYECALETIGNVIALKARDIAEEQAKPSPDTNRITELRRQQAELAGERKRCGSPPLDHRHHLNDHRVDRRYSIFAVGVAQHRWRDFAAGDRATSVALRRGRRETNTECCRNDVGLLP